MDDRCKRSAAPILAGRGAALLLAAAAVAMPIAASAQTTPAQPAPAARPAAPPPAPAARPAAPAATPAAPAQAKPAAPAAKPGAPAAAAAAPKEGEGAKLAPGQPNPWVKLCSKDAEKRDVCLVAQELRGDQDQVVGSVAIREIQNDPKKILLIAVPPLNLIQPGLRVGVDKGKLEEGKYTICFPNACYAEMPISDQFIAGMKKGQVLIVRTLNLQEKQQAYPFTLAGFKEAHEGEGIDPNAPAQAAAGQAELKQELERRADEARQKLTNEAKKP